LLFVSKLFGDSDLVALLTQKGFMVQDPITKKVMAGGNKESKLKAADSKYKPIISDDSLHDQAGKITKARLERL